MTLMAFLRDYVFLPLSGLGVRTARQRLVMHFAAIVFTMALCGLWHGASWSFVLWGALNGLAVVVATLWRRYLPSPPALLGWTLTVAFFLLTAVLFRAPSMQAAWNIYAGLAMPPDFGRLMQRGVLLLAAFCAIGLPASQDIAARLLERPRAIVAAALALVAVAILVELGDKDSYDFIYFQF
jgi:D-alanyl-lipoteichoic acid acyltransferase DltB (MBOAT superfamily)